MFTDFIHFNSLQSASIGEYQWLVFFVSLGFESLDTLSENSNDSPVARMGLIRFGQAVIKADCVGNPARNLRKRI